MNLKSIFVLAGCVGLIGSGQARADDIFRWVDDQGRTHLSDTVPARYESRAVRIDAAQYEATPQQQREARALAAREAALARAAVARPANEPAPAGSLSGQAPTDCESRWRRYDRSQACFQRFRNADGSVKAGAYRRCENLIAPTVACGSRTMP